MICCFFHTASGHNVLTSGGTLKSANQSSGIMDKKSSQNYFHVVNLAFPVIFN